VVDAKATGVNRLHKYDGGRASGSISQMRGPDTKVLWNTDLEEPTTFKRRKFAQQELGNDIQSGEHSSVRLFPVSSYKNQL
jgi:hypothetical protein